MGKFKQFLQQIERSATIDRIIPNSKSTVMLVISYDRLYFYFLNVQRNPIMYQIDDSVTGVFWSGHSDDLIVMCYSNGDIVLRSIHDINKVIKRMNVQGLLSMRSNSSISPWGRYSLLVCADRCLKIITPFVEDNLVIDEEEMNELRNETKDSYILFPTGKCFENTDGKYRLKKGLGFITQASEFVIKDDFESNIVDVEWDNKYIYALLENNKLYIMKLADKFPQFDSYSKRLNIHKTIIIDVGNNQYMSNIDETCYLLKENKIFNISDALINDNNVVLKSYTTSNICLIGSKRGKMIMRNIFNNNIMTNNIDNFKADDESFNIIKTKVKEEEKEIRISPSDSNIIQLRIEANIKKRHLENRIRSIIQRGERLQSLRKECEEKYLKYIGQDMDISTFNHIQSKINESYKILYQLKKVQQPFINDIVNEKLHFDVLKSKSNN